MREQSDSLRDPRPATVAAYDADAAAYAAAGPALTDPVRWAIERFAHALPPGSRVLEVGSGSGRDAAALERLGVRVRRTDVTPGFVRLLREQGHRAEVLDPLTDDLTDPEGPHDGVWANASLLHVTRPDLPRVLERLRAATRAGGLLRFTVKEGDGDGWSTHGAVTAPRHFTYWRAAEVREATVAAGWADVVVTGGHAGTRQEAWLEVTAVAP